jgi:group I intron endonuclease
MIDVTDSFSKIDLPCVYLIENQINKKIYVGSAKSLKNRIYRHFKMPSNKKKASIINKTVFKHGKENFKVFVLEYVNNDKLIETEQKWLDHYKPYDKTIGYNICNLAGNSSGIKHTNKTKRLMKEKAKLRKMQGENNPMFGTKRPKHVIDAVRKANKGRIAVNRKSINQIDIKTGKIKNTFHLFQLLHIH